MGYEVINSTSACDAIGIRTLGGGFSPLQRRIWPLEVQWIQRIELIPNNVSRAIANLSCIRITKLSRAACEAWLRTQAIPINLVNRIVSSVAVEIQPAGFPDGIAREPAPYIGVINPVRGDVQAQMPRCRPFRVHKDRNRLLP